MGTAARVAVATGSSTGVSSYSMIMFTGWDYSCLGDRATKLKQKNILYQLQVRRDLSYLTGWSAGKEKRDPHVAALLHSFVYTMCLQVTPHFSSLPRPGGSGGGESKETQGWSVNIKKSDFILSACFNDFSFTWVHWRSFLRHLCDHTVQPGKRCKNNDANMIFLKLWVTISHFC